MSGRLTPTLQAGPFGRSRSVGGVPRSASSRRHYKVGRKETGVAGQASWASSVVNLVNTIVGAGVLAMPLAVARMGIVLGCAVILWAGLTAGFGLYLQTKCARYLDRGAASFFALSQITYPNAAVLFDAAIAIKCFGVGVSYLIIIGDLMPGVVRGIRSDDEDVGFLMNRHFWVTGFMLIVIPLSFLRRLDSLKYTSFVALVSIGYLVLLVVAHFVRGDTTPDTETPIRVVHWESALATLSSVPVIVFAYTCHQNMFSVLNEIGNNSHFRTTAVVVASIGVAAFIYILVAITGYLSFGNSVSGNIVALYPSSVTATIGKAAIVILVMFSYPLQVHPCRASVDAVLKWRPIKRRPDRRNGENPQRQPSPSHTLTRPPRTDSMSETRFAAITTTIIILSYITAMTVSSLEKVLAYVGSTGSTSISFILPGLFYYKISSPDSPHHQRLLKEDDDNDDDEDEVEHSSPSNSGEHDEEGGAGGQREDEGLLLGGGKGAASTTDELLHRWRALWTRPFRRKFTRKLSLALAIYGVVVMVVCLVTNTLHVAVLH